MGRGRGRGQEPAADTWTRRRDLPTGLTHAGLAVAGRSLYLAGGYPQQADGTGQNFSTTAVWRYDTDTDTYTALPAMPVGRGGGALVLHGRTLLASGGADDARRDTATHYALDLDGGTACARSPPWPYRATTSARSPLGSRVYAVAGQTGQDAAATYRAHVHAYDPATQHLGRQSPDAPVAVPQQRLDVRAGGAYHRDLAARPPTTKEVLAYDLAAGRLDRPDPAAPGAQRRRRGHLGRPAVPRHRHRLPDDVRGDPAALLADRRDRLGRPRDSAHALTAGRRRRCRRRPGPNTH